MKMMFRITLMLTLCVLSACATTHNLEELRRVTPRGTPYAIALTQKYLAFSEQEAASYDWRDSSYFAEKGLMAGYGQEVTAEEIAGWDVPEDMKPELAAARERLMEIVTEEVRLMQPQLAADAVFSYDCWLEELEENTQGTDATRCQLAFYNAIQNIEFAAMEAAEAAADEQAAERIANTAYLVYFGTNSTDFDEAAKQVVGQVLADVQARETGEIIIHGHTDRSGSAEYNLNLSEKRALSVIEALIDGGVVRDIIKYFAFGETDNAVPTEDGVKEPKNRRVEIFMD